MSRVALVVLDLIGTTVQADDAVPQAFAAALAAEGVSIAPDALAALRGATKRQAVQALLPPGPDLAARVERAYGRFQTRLFEAYTPGRVAPIAGALEAIDALRGAGARVALNSGFDRALASHLLDALGWTAVADVLVAGDEVPQGRPAPFLIYRAMERTGVIDVGRVANVGDTVVDLEAGHHARTGWNIGVWSGAHDRARLAAAPYTHLCASIADVPAVLGLA
ncbi:MAG: HAD family hydrolase [Vicinamibacterales bacterium]